MTPTHSARQPAILVDDGSAGNDDVPTRYTAKAYTGKSICVGAAGWVGESLADPAGKPAR